MIVSQVYIFNLALGHVPAAEVASPNEQSKSAKACRRFWDAALGYVVEAGNWNYARRRVTLAALDTNDREGVWGFAYALPGDMAFPVRLLPNVDAPGSVYLQVGQTSPNYGGLDDDPGSRYDMAGTTLYADLDSPTLEYLSSDVQASDLMPSGTLTLALSYQLAALIYPSITGSATRVRELLATAEVYLDRARAKNFNAVPRQYGHVVPEVLQARTGLIDPTAPWPVAGWPRS